MGLWVAIGVLTAAALAALLPPLVRRARAPAASRAQYDLTVYRDQLDEVERDRERGVLGDEEARAARTEIERRMLAAMPENGPEPAPSPNPPSLRRRLPVIAAIAVAVPAGAIGLYLLVGSPDVPDRPFAGRVASPAGAGATRGDAASFEAVVGRLAERLLRNPDDLNGWLLLARSYMTLERFDAAANAFRHALGLSNNRADIAAEYGEALLIAGNAAITPEIRQIFEGVVAADPRNPKARYYLGMGKAQRGDVRGALQDWVDLQAVSPPDAPWRPVVRRQIERAARQIDVDPATVKPSPEALALGAARPKAPAGAGGPSPADIEAIARMSEEERAAMIRSMVDRLAGRLEKNPDDADGWRRLARAYEVLGEKEKARQAKARAEAAAKKGR